MNDAQDTFLTISAKSEAVFKEKGSKFLAFAFPVGSEEDVKEELDFLRKKYFDASHHCYAYRLGVNGEQYRANDDGEPANSAGKPILGQLISCNVTNVLVVVVRYFGGTLLGVGGLIKAYKQATAAALAAAEIVTETVTETYQLKFDYNAIGQVLKVVEDMSLDKSFNDDFSMTVKVRKSRSEEMKKRLKTIDTLSVLQKK